MNDIINLQKDLKEFYGNVHRRLKSQQTKSLCMKSLISIKSIQNNSQRKCIYSFTSHINDYTISSKYKIILPQSNKHYKQSNTVNCDHLNIDLKNQDENNYHTETESKMDLDLPFKHAKSNSISDPHQWNFRAHRISLQSEFTKNQSSLLDIKKKTYHYK